MHSGFLNVNKPRLLSSHDVVNRIRRITGERRAGHAGTLDPLASGVLIICLGQATRLSEYAAEGHKTYLATLHLGKETSTYDAEGEVTAAHPVDGVTRADIEQALVPLRGVSSQLPPMFSAVKHNGKALYKLARRGITIERIPRTITIYQCEILRFELPEMDLRITCSGGTYVRTIAHDVGRALGVGAYLAGLVRERAGAFGLAQAVTLEALQGTGEESWLQYLQPMQTGLSHLPGVTVDATQETDLRNGLFAKLPDLPTESLAYAVNPGGQVFAILRYRPEDGLWQPAKVLNV